MEKRLQRHKTGQVQPTRGFRPFSLVHVEDYSTRAEAVRREKQLKSWKNHTAIQELISDFEGLIV
jgi:putative endonuclease